MTSPGRQPVYTEELAERILEMLADGILLREIGRMDDMPSYRTVYRWATKGHPEYRADFEARFARARDIGDEVTMEDCQEIADDGTNDWMKRREAREGQPEGVTFDAEHVQRSKLRIWTRLERLKRRNPAKYGDRTTLAGDPNAPLNSKVTHDLAGLTPEQLRAIASIHLKEQE